MAPSSNLLSFVPVSNSESRPNSTDGARPRPVVVESEVVESEVVETGEEASLRKITEAALAATGASGAALALRRGGSVVCLARAGEMAPPLGARLDDSSGISGECLREGQPIRCDDTESDSRVDAEACRSLGLRSLAIAALRHNTAIVGILEVFSPEPNTFSDKHLDVLQQLAELAVEGLEAETGAATKDPVAEIPTEAVAALPQISTAEPEPARTVLASSLKASPALATPMASDVNIAAYMAAHENEKSKAKVDPRVTKLVLVGLATILIGVSAGLYLDRKLSARAPAVETAPAPFAFPSSAALVPTTTATNSPNKPNPDIPAVVADVATDRNARAVRDSLTNAAKLDHISSPGGHRKTAPLTVVQHQAEAATESDAAPGLTFAGNNSPGNENVANILSAPAALPQKAPAISQGVEGGEIETTVPAIYPTQARAMGQHGTVVLDALIAEDGSVRDVKVVSGPPLLRQAAVDAVRRWKYKPYKLNGKAVTAQTQVKLDFKPQ